jgi:hypothetical protein
MYPKTEGMFGIHGCHLPITYFQVIVPKIVYCKCLSYLLLTYNPKVALISASSSVNLFNATAEFSMCVMFLKSTDAIFLGFAAICSTLSRFWYEQESWDILQF